MWLELMFSFSRPKTRLIVGLFLIVLSNWHFAAASVVKRGSISGTLSEEVEHSIPEWFKESFLDIEDDLEQADSRQKHLILFFYMSDCPYCHKMLHDSFLPSRQRQRIQDYFDVVAINTKGDREVIYSQKITLSEKQLAQSLNVRYTPTILFLNGQQKVVARINGYRSQEKFNDALNYVSNRAYLNLSLNEYISQIKLKEQQGGQPSKPQYILKSHPRFQSIRDFSQIKNPLAILFEDSSCQTCGWFHEKILNHPAVLHELAAFQLVRLDADSELPLITPDGKQSNPRSWSNQANLSYRPGILLFDQGREVTRIDGMLYHFHFKEVLRYVSSKAYLQFDSYGSYLSERQNQLLEQGVDIQITD